MELQLIKGEFKPGDALDLINRMIQTKIRYHEDQICQHSTEEDIKYRESRIKQLQNEWHIIRSNLNENIESVKMDATINFY